MPKAQAAHAQQVPYQQSNYMRRRIQVPIRPT
jgi:hypothetical protein